VTTDPAVTAKQLVDLARKHIEDQQNRIVRQRELMAKYERDDDAARLSEARRVLEKMQKQLVQMTAGHVTAEEAPREASIGCRTSRADRSEGGRFEAGIVALRLVSTKAVART
jgi:hypothetical protein